MDVQLKWIQPVCSDISTQREPKCTPDREIPARGDILMKTFPKTAGDWWHLGPAVQRINALKNRKLVLRWLSIPRAQQETGKANKKTQHILFICLFPCYLTFITFCRQDPSVLKNSRSWISPSFPTNFPLIWQLVPKLLLQENVIVVSIFHSF